MEPDQRLKPAATICFILFILVGVGLLFNFKPVTPTQAAVDAPQGAAPGRDVAFQNGCSCSGGDTLNCTDFASQADAQNCFNQCISSVGYDVHDLDANGDGLACEGTTYNGQTGPTATPQPAQSQNAVCDCSGDTLGCTDFDTRGDAQACYDYCLGVTNEDVHGLDDNNNGLVCENTLYIRFATPPPTSTPTGALTPQAQETPPAEAPTPTAQQVVPAATVAGANNLVYNGNFEFGFYPVPELGFEPPDTGAVPNNWGWYKSNTYGKVTIYNNEAFGLVCADDTGAQRAVQPSPEDAMFGPIPGVTTRQRRPNNSVSLHMQSTDQQDMRLGIYQTVNVVPGQYYRFSMSGTVQVQSGATTLQSDDPFDPIEAQNHTFEISFDHRGGDDWQAIPLERRQIWNLREEKLEFKVSEDNEDIAEIQDFATVVRAKSDRMTIFITGWRKWANWRTAIFTVDCISLVPSNAAGVALPGQAPVTAPVTGKGGVQPAALQPDKSPGEAESQIIPPSGGILDKGGNTILVLGAAAVVLLGLIGAGIWNIRRR